MTYSERKAAKLSASVGPNRKNLESYAKSLVLDSNDYMEHYGRTVDGFGEHYKEAADRSFNEALSHVEKYDLCQITCGTELA